VPRAGLELGMRASEMDAQFLEMLVRYRTDNAMRWWSLCFACVMVHHPLLV